MYFVGNEGDARHRRRLTTRVKGSLRDVRSQLALLNRQVGTPWTSRTSTSTAWT